MTAEIFNAGKPERRGHNFEVPGSYGVSDQSLGTRTWKV
jgi:hypothetical protein